jgi:glycogen(starch) synthase
MRILMYGWEFPPHISGGLGVACFELTRALAQQGHRITFVLPRLREDLAGQGSHVDLLGLAQFVGGLQDTIDEETRRFLEGVDVAPVDSPLRPYLNDIEYRRVLELIEEIGLHRRTGSTGFGVTMTGDYGPNLMSEVVRYAKAAGAVAGRVPHDVIHAHDWLTMLAGLEARRVSGRPLVVHVHALEFDRSGEQVNQAVYDLTAQTIAERYGVDPAKIAVVHNAVTRKARTQPVTRGGRREKVVLFLGRITFQKGPDYFVEAAARVLSRRDDVRFVMAGSGDMAPRMIERVGALRLGRRIHFTGFLTGAAVERMYLESDVYVMPSVSEPFGLSPLEAMCYDVPVIISRQSGVAEVLRHALKVDFWNVEELASKIIALVDHEPLRDELVSQGARELENLQWSNAAGKLTGIYGQLAAGVPGT